jgi:hypothetical protein
LFVGIRQRALLLHLTKAFAQLTFRESLRDIETATLQKTLTDLPRFRDPRDLQQSLFASDFGDDIHRASGILGNGRIVALHDMSPT